MEVTICGHRKAVEVLKQNPKQIDVVFISSPDNKFGVDGSHLIQDLAKNYCEILFDDCTFPVGSMIPPTIENVKQAIEFAKGKESIIVCCQAGVSRSAATAYCIATDDVGPIMALEILDPKVHSPNALIVHYGSKILNCPDMVDIINTWKNEADAQQMW